MKALAISIVAGAALCGALAVPASAMPVSNLTAAVSELAVGQSVRYVRNHYRDRDSSSGYPGNTDNCYGYGFGPSSPCYP
jgi:hypothetical protein